MAKEKIKDKAAERQDGKSSTGADLPRDEEGNLIHPLTDTHRPIPKKDGGEYDETTEVMTAKEHQAKHGNTPWLNDPELIELRAIMEDYRTCMKARMKIHNQRLAVARRMDEVTPEIEAMFETTIGEIAPAELYFRKRAEKQLAKVSMPVIGIMQNIKGVGPITTAECVTLLNITIADTPSDFWKFVGYHCPAGERYVKGVKGGGHKHLRTVCYNVGMSLIKANNMDYRELYDRRKAKQQINKREVMHAHRLKGENGRSQYIKKMTPWKDVSDGHRHMDALRIMNKAFLADLWFVWRTISGLPTRDLWIKEHGGHESGTILPRERGWEF